MKDGELLSVGGRYELRFTRALAHPVRRSGTRSPPRPACRAWFPFDVDGARATGASLRFVFREGEGDDFHGSMVEFEPESVMELRWEGDETLRLELRRVRRRAACLTLINRFDEIGKAARDAAGWHACLDAARGSLDGSSRRRRRDAGSPCTRSTSRASAPRPPTIGPPTS